MKSFLGRSFAKEFQGALGQYQVYLGLLEAIHVSDTLYLAIYVEEDWTDFDVVGHLLAAGIPQEDIVLAFHHPTMRRYTEFAPA